MNRKEFFRNSLMMGGAIMLPSGPSFAASENVSEMDKLVDENGNFVQQPLPYAQIFLEPVLDAETMYIHFTFHHGGAVKAANIAQKKIKEAIDNNNLETVDFWTKKLSYHFSSHILHSIFWTNLINKQSNPNGELLKRIEKNFGSYDKFKTYLTVTSTNVDGNGWGILGYQPYSDSLVVMQCENYEKLTLWGVIPILAIDVCEHAYYLKYKNKREDYVNGLFNIINWDNVSQRLDLALNLTNKIVSRIPDNPEKVSTKTQDVPEKVSVKTQDMPDKVTIKNQDMPEKVSTKSQDIPTKVPSNNQEPPEIAK
jgi:superoxide dismutase, Fe-Mn family